MKNTHARQRHHGISLFDSADFHQINQYRANRAMQEHDEGGGATCHFQARRIKGHRRS